MRIAIVCSGLDSIRRGYETHSRLLFESLQKEIGKDQVFLFKRDGTRTSNEIVLNVPSRKSKTAQFLARYRGTAFYWEHLLMAFRFVLYANLRRQQFDKVITTDTVTPKVISRFRKFIPGACEVIYTHGVSQKPELYIHVADKIQEINIENYHRSLQFRTASSPKIALIPYFGPAKDSFLSDEQKEQLRKELGISTPYILLNVGIINRAQKRTHYVIQEAAKLSNDWSLVICGRGDPELINLGKKMLGARFLNLFLPREELEKVYQIADLFVLASTQEGLGIVILEAMSNKLPVILHNRELFRWISADEEVCIDMTVENNLANFITLKAEDEMWRTEKGKQNYNNFLDRFSWDAVKDQYLDFILS